MIAQLPSNYLKSGSISVFACEADRNIVFNAEATEAKRSQINYSFLCSPDEVKRNPGQPHNIENPDFASLHPGYILSGIDRFFSTQPGLAIQKA